MYEVEENIIHFDEPLVKTDKNRVKHKVQVLSGKYYKNVIVESYGSGCQGSRIRNAFTGIYYPDACYKVGSIYDDILFKIIDSTAVDGRREPLMLYYDNPEQYERHQHATLSQQTKQAWTDKQLTINV
jgi:hypothetical protein